MPHLPLLLAVAALAAEEPAPAVAATAPEAAAPAATVAPVAPAAAATAALPDIPPPIPAYEVDAEEAATVAAANAEAVAGAAQSQIIAEAQARQGWAFALPGLMASGSQTRTQYQPPWRFGRPPNVPSNGEDAWYYGVRADQLIYQPYRLSAASSGAASVRAAASAELAQARRDASSRARLAVEAVRFARERTALAEATLRQRDSELTDARVLLLAGRARAFEVRQAEISRSDAQDEASSAATALASAQAELRAALNLRPGQMVKVRGDLVRPSDLARLLAAAEAAVGGGPEIAALRAAQLGQRALDQQTDADASPKLSAFATWGSAGTRRNDMDERWSAGLEATWKLYDGGDRAARSVQAQAGERRLQHQVWAQARERRREVEQARGEADRLGGRIADAERTVKLAEENYEDIRAQFRAGRLTRTQLDEGSLQVTRTRFRLAELVYQESVLAHRLRRLAE